MAKQDEEPQSQPVTRLSDRDVQSAMAVFNHVFGVIDAAVTGAVIAGIQPYAFEAPLSFWFLRAAAGARGKEKSIADVWMSSPTVVFDPVVKSVIEFGRDYQGQVEDKGEIEEFEALVAGCVHVTAEINDVEKARQARTAVSVVEWVMRGFERADKPPAVLVEVALLAQWLKVAALGRNVEKQVYFTVKQTAPLVCQHYNELLVDMVKA